VRDVRERGRRAAARRTCGPQLVPKQRQASRTTELLLADAQPEDGDDARPCFSGVSGHGRCGADGCVEPILAWIPADGDADADAILELVRAEVTIDLLDCMNGRDAIALGRYVARHTTIALRLGCAALLRDALLATAICQVIRIRVGRDSASVGSPQARV